MNSFTSPNEAFVLSVPASSREKVTMQQITNLSTSLTEHLSMDSGEEFWFSGADPDQQVHGFLMRPHGFEKGKQYGMVFLVHGEVAAI
jgi:dipeptidyl aminopeptidase/acylaminoacyl peptidase